MDITQLTPEQQAAAAPIAAANSPSPALPQPATNADLVNTAAPDLGNPSTAPGGFGQKLSDALTAAAAQPGAPQAVKQPGGFAKLFLSASLDALAKGGNGGAPHGLGVALGIGGDAGSNLSGGQGALAGIAKAQKEVAALKQQKLENAQKVQTMNMEQQKTAAQLEQIHQQTIMNQRAIFKANEEDRKAHIADGSGITKSYEDAGYDVEHDISQAELEQRHQKDLELEKQNPKAVTYASQHQIIQTGENPVIGADGKEKVDKDGHTIYSPVYSAIDVADKPAGTGMVEVTPEMSKSFKDNLGLDVPAGAKVPGLALSYSIVQNQGIANSYRLIRRANGGDLDAAKKDQVRIDVQDPAVQMGLASVPGRPIRGLNNMASSLQTAIDGTPAVTDVNGKVTKPAVPGLQAQVAALQQLQKANPNDPRVAALPDLQKHLADAQQGLQKVNRVLAVGFNEAAEKDEIAAQKTDEKDAQDRARDAETARHNRIEEQQKQAELTFKQKQADGDIESAAELLRSGNMDPSQLSKRSGTYQATLDAADRQEMAETGQHFNIAQATTDYKYANNAKTKDTLNMINGMTEPGGSIDIAKQTVAKLPQFSNSTVNKVFNATATEMGSPEATDFHTAMLGLADEYSKVMGGGVATDTGRQQALDLLRASYSKGQMSGAIDIMQRDIAARQKAIIGNNRYLKQEYGVQTQSQQTQQTAQNQRQNQTPAPNTHVFDPTAWQKAHPGQDVSAATAYAVSQGYQVKH